MRTRTGYQLEENNQTGLGKSLLILAGLVIILTLGFSFASKSIPVSMVLDSILSDAKTVCDNVIAFLGGLI